ncbi:hypothetical protein BGZ46_009275 [Entomortierella lignicola]|nr:hypothetical protein BGZ46_009275 [Entomortierella lignicola]
MDRRCQYDKETSRLFYIDITTGKRQWEHPNGHEAGLSDAAQFREQMDIYEQNVARYNHTYGIDTRPGTTYPQMSEQFSHGQNPRDSDISKGDRSSVMETSATRREGGETSSRAGDVTTRHTTGTFILQDEDDDDDRDHHQARYDGERNYKATDLSNDDGRAYFSGNDINGFGSGYNSIDHFNSSEGTFIGSGKGHTHNVQTNFYDLSDNRVGQGNFLKERTADDDFYDRINSGW